MKLIIQIPCYNEEESLPAAVRALPRSLPGIDRIEILVVDDGSSDGTAAAARKAGVDHILRLPAHAGLARAFAAGLEAACAAGADFIVNTDGDNQYCADDIGRLLAPLLAGRAQIAVGDRGVGAQRVFSPAKRLLQRLGSWLVSLTAGMRIPDATSGFRAYTRGAALRTLVLSSYSYTLETLIQAGARREPIAFVPVRINPPVRPSRLMRGQFHYLASSGATIMRSFLMYRPLRVFSILGALFFLTGLALAGRYLYFFLEGNGAGHVQSVILAAILLIVGIQVFLIGLVADLIAFNRRMLEELLERSRRQDLQPATDTSRPARKAARPRRK
jgi:glycosyltransferase involved in cell wall biosynthesis